MSKRQMMGILSLFLIGIIGCTPVQKSSLEPFKVAIAYIPNMQFTPFYVAIDQGFFDEVGLDLIIEYGFSADVMGLVAGGLADAALADADQLLIAQNVLPVSAFFQYYHTLPMALLSLSSGLLSPHHLNGKTIGVSELFGSSYLALQAFIRENELQDISIERIGYTQLMALERGLVDATVVYANNEPLVLKNNGTDFTLWQALESPLAGSVLVTSSTPKAVAFDKLQRFSLALQRGMQFTIAHPEEAAQIALGYIDGAEFELTLQGIQATIPYFSVDNKVNITHVMRTQELMKQLGFLTSDVREPSVLNVW